MTVLPARPARRLGPDRAGRHRRRPTLALTGVAAGVLVVAAAVYAVASLALADRHVRSAAAAMRNDLNHYRAALLAGSTGAAQRWLAQARRDLRAAHHDVTNPAVRAAGHLPVLGGAVADVHRLLSAADILVQTAGETYTLYGDVGGRAHALFHDHTFDIPLITRTDGQARQILGRLATARRLLQHVHGGMLESGVAKARDRALAQLGKVDSDLRGALTFLDVLPGVVGATGPRSYLVVILNPAEQRYSGGAPLALLQVNFRNGRMMLANQGQTAELTARNGLVSWPAVPGDIWAGTPAGGTLTSRFVDANFNPDFRISGEEMLRAYQAQFAGSLDGVIGVTPEAMADLLSATGPVRVVGYGVLTKDNLVSTLIGSAYNRFNPTTRHALNKLAMASLLRALTQGGHLFGKMRALSAAVPGHYLQMYFRDRALEQLVLRHHLGGELPRTSGDLTAVFTQNVNGSKADYYLRRDVHVVVRLQADGNALVTRTVAITNTAPPYTGIGPDPKHGEFTPWAADHLAEYLPVSSRLIDLSLDGTPEPLPALQHAGPYPAFAQTVWIGPGTTVRLTMRYWLWHAAQTYPGGRRVFSERVRSQPTVLPGTLLVEVWPADGVTFGTAPGWHRHGAGVSVRTRTDHDVSVFLSLTTP